MFLSNGQAVPTTVASAGDGAPAFSEARYHASAGLPLLNTFAAYAAIYKTQLWVGTVVRKRAAAASRMPFEIKKRVSATDSVSENGPLTELMARPNAHMSGLGLWRWTSSTRDVYGEAFWVKLRDRRGRVRELHPMHPTNVIVRRLPDGSVGYVYANGPSSGGDLPVIPASDVVAFTSYNPDNLARGLSPLESLRMTLLNEDAARRATASMWQKGARPAMFLSHPGTLSDGANKRLKAQFDATHAGADNTGSTAVFEEGITAQVVQLNAEEMQYIESRKMNREEVCAVYDMPPPAVGILDRATFSNITEQLRSLYRDTMAPVFMDFESVIDDQLVPDFYRDRTVFSRFTMEEVLRGDFETKATATVAMRNAGFVTGNEARSLFGLPKSNDPEMDRVYANAALIPLGSAADAASGSGSTPTRADTIDVGEIVATPVPAPPPLAAVDEGVAARPPSAVAIPVASPAELTRRQAEARSLMGRLGRARQQGASMKTWVADPACTAHAGVAGETVGIGGVFSNGARVPGDDAAAGCGCDVTFGQE